MRMVNYFAAYLALVVPALLTTAALGILGRPVLHVKVGLLAAIFTVGLHSLVILFMLVTGRVLREAIQSRSLPHAFLDELNEFFAKKAAYPAAIVAAFAIVLASVLGYARQGFGLHPVVHMLVGVAAVVFNLWAFAVELQVLRANKSLIDRAANQLDRLDRDRAARGELPPPTEDRLDAARIARGAMIVAISAWLPYLYWGVVEWRGDFSRVGLHPWVEVCAAALLVWWLARREVATGERAQGE